jgi:hypothetical protein
VRTGEANKIIVTPSKNVALSEAVLFSIKGRSAESLSVASTKKFWVSRSNFEGRMAKVYMVLCCMVKIIALLSRGASGKLSHLRVNAK